MATVMQIVDGIETRLKTISGLNVTDYVPEQVNPPQAFVDVPSIDYRRSFGTTGLRSIDLTVTILVSAAYVGHQKKLLPFIDQTGAQSVFAAIEADPTLGLTNIECHIAGPYQRLGLQEVGLIGYYGGVFQLTCLATG